MTVTFQSRAPVLPQLDTSCRALTPNGATLPLPDKGQSREGNRCEREPAMEGSAAASSPVGDTADAPHSDVHNKKAAAGLQMLRAPPAWFLTFFCQLLFACLLGLAFSATSCPPCTDEWLGQEHPSGHANVFLGHGWQVRACAPDSCRTRVLPLRSGIRTKILHPNLSPSLNQREVLETSQHSPNAFLSGPELAEVTFHLQNCRN